MGNTENTMSRGLGKMQRLILASLKPAKQAYVEGKFNYVGAARFANVAHLSDLYDLRATLPYLAIRLSERPGKRKRRPISEDLRVVDQTFRVAFCQAAHTLVERGLLIPCDDEDAKQLRFVSMRPDIFVVHPQIRLKSPAPELTRMLRVLLSKENTIDENDAAQQLHAVVGLLAASGLTFQEPSLLSE
jgi:hypothetical protein